MADWTEGVIRVTKDGISASRINANGHCSADGIPLTLEGLEYAALVLGRWLKLPSTDVARECQRVHQGDQMQAAISEAIDQYTHDRIPQEPTP